MKNRNCFAESCLNANKNATQSDVNERISTFLNPHPGNWGPSGPHVYVLCEIVVNNNHIPSWFYVFVTVLNGIVCVKKNNNPIVHVVCVYNFALGCMRTPMSHVRFDGGGIAMHYQAIHCVVRCTWESNQVKREK
jgi:hypothetical protein